MLYTVLMLVSNVEQTFNEIWQVRNSRDMLRTFPTYLAIFFLFPLMVVVATGISVFMATMAKSIPDMLLLRPVVKVLIDVSPYVLMSAMFIALYVLMPNTKVKLRCAIVPGIVAGVAMQWLQLFYIHSQLWVTGYNAIYGSFAALPLFMLWVQISWDICLFGAQLTYTNQNLNRYGINLEEEDFHTYIEVTDDERSDSSIAVYSDGLEGL
jgi:membrane protein